MTVELKELTWWALLVFWGCLLAMMVSKGGANEPVFWLIIGCSSIVTASQWLSGPDSDSELAR